MSGPGRTRPGIHDFLGITPEVMHDRVELDLPLTPAQTAS